MNFRLKKTGVLAVFIFCSTAAFAQLDRGVFKTEAAPALFLLTQKTMHAPPTLAQFFQLEKACNNSLSTPLPFFCKMEVHMEKATRFPVKVRLGDIDRVDFLEGKGGVGLWFY